MDINDIHSIIRSFMWFVMSAIVWLGMKDYFESKFDRTTRRWKFIQAGLAFILVGNFVIFVYILSTALGAR